MCQCSDNRPYCLTYRFIRLHALENNLNDQSDVLNDKDELFAEGIGTLKNTQVKIHVEKNEANVR